MDNGSPFEQVIVNISYVAVCTLRVPTGVWQPTPFANCSAAYKCLEPPGGKTAPLEVGGANAVGTFGEVSLALAETGIATGDGVAVGIAGCTDAAGIAAVALDAPGIDGAVG